jgi:hypothetical protein
MSTAWPHKFNLPVSELLSPTLNMLKWFGAGGDSHPAKALVSWKEDIIYCPLSKAVNMTCGLRFINSWVQDIDDYHGIFMLLIQLDNNGLFLDVDPDRYSRWKRLCPVMIEPSLTYSKCWSSDVQYVMEDQRLLNLSEHQGYNCWNTSVLWSLYDVLSMALSLRSSPDDYCWWTTSGCYCRTLADA